MNKQMSSEPGGRSIRWAPALILGLCLAGCGSTPSGPAIVFSENQGAALPCDVWSEPVQIGLLDHQAIDEASGMAFSRAHADRLYHHNDSGDGPYFYVTNGSGAETQRIIIDGFEPFDVESMALGPCPSQGDCIYLGDIGDNLRVRADIEIVVVREVEDFPDRVAALKTITARYPDAAHDAEGMAMHPNGDLYILTKEMNWILGRASPAQLYRIPASQIADNEGETLTMEHVGGLDLPRILSAHAANGRIVTGLDISPDGERAIILTYLTALELRFEPLIQAVAEGRLPEQENYRNIAIHDLPQMEAITYAPDGNAFLYDTEYNQSLGSVPIYRVACSAAATES